VYVVLEAQYQASLGSAVNKINAHRKEVCVELVGYLLEELRDAKNFEAFKKDVANGESAGCGWQVHGLRRSRGFLHCQEWAETGEIGPRSLFLLCMSSIWRLQALML
jgi:hypothetical protein